MKKILIVCVLTLVYIFNSKTSFAQVDPHFSQYYMYPLWLNPALTGAMDGDYRVTGNYRNQWAGITNPFSTAGISGDMTTEKNINLGANIMNQTAGDGGYNYLNGYLSVAYTGVRFGKDGNNHIAFGMNVGVINRRINPSKFQFGDQFNSSTGSYDPNAQSGEAFSKTSSAVADIGAGVLYYDGNPDRKYNLYGGFSASHLTQPKDPFLTTGNQERLPIRYTFHGGIRAVLSETVTVVPNGLYMRQGTAEEKMGGVYVELAANKTTDFLCGVNYRFKDAWVPFAGLYFNNYTIGLSYDVNSSDLGKSTTGTSSFEISMSYIFKKPKTFEPGYFKCPRL